MTERLKSSVRILSHLRKINPSICFVGYRERLMTRDMNVILNPQSQVLFGYFIIDWEEVRITNGSVLNFFFLYWQIMDLAKLISTNKASFYIALWSEQLCFSVKRFSQQVRVSNYFCKETFMFYLSVFLF